MFDLGSMFLGVTTGLWLAVGVAALAEPRAKKPPLKKPPLIAEPLPPAKLRECLRLCATFGKVTVDYTALQQLAELDYVRVSVMLTSDGFELLREYENAPR